MGAYTDNLYRRNRGRSTRIVERLIGCAIVRDGELHTMTKGSHAQVRAKLGDEDIYTSKPGDTEGFMTSKNRFVDRYEAQIVGEKAGQCCPMTRARTLLSSDIDW